jgi:hypothetical protein
MSGHVGHERRDIDPGRIVRAAGAVLVFLAVSMVIAWAVTRGLVAAREARSPVPSPVAERLGPRLPPEPRLQTHPAADLERLRARDARRLSSYGWVDREGRIAHVPIDRAMALLAERAEGHR